MNCIVTPTLPSLNQHELMKISQFKSQLTDVDEELNKSIYDDLSTNKEDGSLLGRMIIGDVSCVWHTNENWKVWESWDNFWVCIVNNSRNRRDFRSKKLKKIHRGNRINKECIRYIKSQSTCNCSTSSIRLVNFLTKFGSNRMSSSKIMLVANCRSTIWLKATSFREIKTKGWLIKSGTLIDRLVGV